MCAPISSTNTRWRSIFPALMRPFWKYCRRVFWASSRRRRSSGRSRPTARALWGRVPSKWCAGTGRTRSCWSVIRTTPGRLRPLCTRGPAYLDRIIWKIIPDSSVRFASVQSGDVDVIDNLPPEAHAPARGNPDITLVLRDRPGNPTHGGFNTTREPFNDLRVREAFVRAANVAGALKSVFFGEFPRAEGPLSSVTPFLQRRFRACTGLRSAAGRPASG